MLLLFLLGCQTTNTTPKEVSTATHVEETQKELPKDEKKEPTLDLVNPVVMHKPLLCGAGGKIIEGIVNTHNERPVGWFISRTQEQEHKVLIMANTEKGTVSILEYPNPNIACFLVVGEDFEMTSEIKSKKTKSDPVSHKRVLTLN
jgi:hypothetical protein